MPKLHLRSHVGRKSYRLELNIGQLERPLTPRSPRATISAPDASMTSVRFSRARIIGCCKHERRDSKAIATQGVDTEESRIGTRATCWERRSHSRWCPVVPANEDAISRAVGNAEWYLARGFDGNLDIVTTAITT